MADNISLDLNLKTNLTTVELTKQLDDFKKTASKSKPIELISPETTAAFKKQLAEIQYQLKTHRITQGEYAQSLYKLNVETYGKEANARIQYLKYAAQASQAAEKQIAQGRKANAAEANAAYKQQAESLRTMLKSGEIDYQAYANRIRALNTDIYGGSGEYRTKFLKNEQTALAAEVAAQKQAAAEEKAIQDAAKEQHRATVDSFKKDYATLKVARDNSVIGEREYYDKLKTLNDSTFGGKSDYLTEYQKYNHEVVTGLNKIEQAEQKLDAQNQNLANSWKAAAENFIRMQVGYRLLAEAKQGFLEMLNVIKELDAALVEYQKVSDMTANQMDAFIARAYKVGESTARTGTQMIQAATEFRKSGYDDQTSLDILAKQATLYQNIADEEVSAGDAAGFIISQLKAFNLEATESAHVVDALNEVSNNYAVSSADLADSIGRVSATMASSGTSYEQTLGMLTAITEITRDANKGANALKIISQRLRGVGEDSEDTTKDVGDLQKQFDKLGIDIQIVNGKTGEMASTFDILSAMNTKWDKLTESQRQSMAELAAGKNRITEFNALMSNFDTALSATATAYDSLGSAELENSKVLDSVAGKTSMLRAQFEQFAQQTLSSDMVKGFLDASTNALKFAEDIGGVRTIVISLLGVVATAKLPAIISTIGAIGTGFSTLTLNLRLVANAVKESIVTHKSFTTILYGEQAAVKGLQLSLGLLTAALTAGLIIFNEVQAAQERQRQAMQDSASAALEDSNKISSLISEYQKLSSQTNKTQSDKDSLNRISKELASTLGIEKDAVAELANGFDDLSQSTKQAALDRLTADFYGLQGGVKAASESLTIAASSSGSLLDGVNSASKAITINGRESIDIVKQLGAEFAVQTDSVNDWINQYSRLYFDTSNVENTLATYQKLGEMMQWLQDQGAGSSVVYSTLLGYYNQLTPAVTSYNDSLANANTNLISQQYLISSMNQQLPTTVNDLNSLVVSMASAISATGNYVGTWDQLYAAVQNYLYAMPQFQQFAQIQSTSVQDLATQVSALWPQVNALVAAMAELQQNGVLSLETVSKLKSLDLGAYLEETENGFELNTDAVSAFMEEVRPVKDAIKALIQNSVDLEDTGLGSYFAMLARAFREFGKNVDDSNVNVDDFVTTIKGLQNQYDILAEAQEQLADSGNLTVDTFAALADNNLLSYLEVVDGKLRVNTDSMDVLAASAQQTAIQMLQDAAVTELLAYAQDTAAGSASTASGSLSSAGSAASSAGSQASSSASGFTDLAAAIWTAVDAASALSGVAAPSPDDAGAQAIVSKYTDAAAAISKINFSGGGGGSSKRKGGGGGGSSKRKGGGGGGRKSSGGGGGGGSSTDKWKDAFDKELKELQYQRDKDVISADDYYTKLAALNEKYFKNKEKYLDEYRQYEVEVYEYLKKKEEDILDARLTLYERFVDQKTDAIEKEIDKLNEERDAEQARLDSEKERLDAALVIYEEYANRQADSIQAQIDAIEAQKTAMSEANEERQKAITLQEKQEALDLAKQNKKRIFKDGKFIYDADATEVAAAQSAITEYNEQLRREAEEAKMNEQIKNLQIQKDKWSEFVSDYKAQQDLLEAERKSGIQLEELLNNKQLANLTKFAEVYGNTYQELAKIDDSSLKAIDDKIDAYEKEKDAWNDFVSDYQDKMDLLEAEQKAGVTLEKLILDERLNNFQSFADAYIKAMNGLKAATTDIASGVLTEAGATANASIVGKSMPLTSAPIPATVSSTNTVNSDNYNFDNVNIVANSPKEFFAELFNTVKNSAIQRSTQRA